MELTLQLPKDGTFSYQPGDSIGMLVPNPPQAVAFVLDMLQQQHGIVRDQLVLVGDETKPVTIEEALCHHIDLSSAIKNRRTIHSLSEYATNQQERTALRLLASKSKSSKGNSQDLFAQYVEGQKLTVIDLLQDFPSCQSIPLGGLFGMLSSTIPTRYYSVSSSPLKSSHELTVAFSVVDYTTPAVDGVTNGGSRRRGGVATRYLEILASPWLGLADDNKSRTEPLSFTKTTLSIFPKPAADFSLPPLQSTPMVLIGPGTGIAPFMGFLQHREEQRTTSDDNKEAGPIDVYFGCRHKDHDYLYKEELKSLNDDSNNKVKLHTAFSRDNKTASDSETTGIKYVQDLMDGALADAIVNDKAIVYVCGDGNAMAKDVQAKIVELLGGKGIESPQDYLQQLKREGRFLLDIWS